MRLQQTIRLAVVGSTAACGLIVEIVAGRMVAPYLGMSLYTWTAIIAVVLAGFSAGHWIGGLLAEREPRQARRGVAWSLLLAAMSTAASLIAIRWLAPGIIRADFGAVPTVLIVTGLLFFLPSLFVGVPSPVLTKLAIDDELAERSGRTIGTYYAISAVGSIAGTLAAGFVFISWLGTTWTLLTVAALYLLMALALFMSEAAGGVTGGRWPAAVVVGFLLVFLPTGFATEAFTDPCRISSSYYCIRVVDVSDNYGAPARALVLDHLGHGINLKDQPQRLVSPYVELQDALARIHSGKRSPFRTFFVGGGAYTLPRAWLAARPDTEATVAEIDPAVTETAVRQLWLQRSKRLWVLHRDARVALGRLPEGYFDVIVGDAFHDIVIPPHLVSREFFALVESRLHSDGIYLMNVVDNRAKPRLALSIAKTMGESFSAVEIWASNDLGGRATYVLAAVRQPTPYAALPSKATPGTRFRRLPKEQLSKLRDALKPVVLTDDYAPVDRLIGVE